MLTIAQGWPIVAFALGGFLLSAAYTAPPLRLKKHGLGEPTVLIVWGPLMVGGTYYAATGTIPGAVVLASLPYALLCTTVLMGKHIDKIPWDAADGTHTLPVIMGERAARRLTQGMFITFYVGVAALVIARILPVASLLIVFSYPGAAPHVRVLQRTEAGGVADAEPGLAAVVRGAVVPRHPAGRRPVRARVAHRRHRRLVAERRGLDLAFGAGAAFAFGCTILFSRYVARDGLPPSIALGVRFGTAGILLLIALGVPAPAVAPTARRAHVGDRRRAHPLRDRVDVLLHGARTRHRGRGRRSSSMRIRR